MRNYSFSIRKLDLRFAAALSCLTLTACRSDAPGDAGLTRVSITIAPLSAGKKPASLLTVRAPNAPSRTYAVPAAVGDFSCFGVNVAGAGIASKRIASACSVPAALDLGVTSELVTATGGTIELLVPAGPARTFQVYGLTTGSGGCPDAAAVIENRAGAGLTSPPYELGRTTVDISASTTVDIASTWSASSPRRAFCNDFVDASSEAKWDVATWDAAAWAP